MNKIIDRIKKTIKTATLIDGAFSVACFAYTVYTLIPKHPKFPGVDAEKLIENVNSKHLERCGGEKENGV